MTNHPSSRLQPIGYIVRWLFLAIGISLGGCASKALSTNSGSEKLQVVTTSTSITDFTKVIAGDYLGDRLHQRAQVTQLLPANIALHDEQVKLADVQQLAKADVLVKNGLEMEGFLNNLVAKAKNVNLKTIDSSQGVQTIVTETIAIDDPNLKAGEKFKAAEHDPREFNSYIWLDPKRAMLQVEKIRDGLIAADPDGKEIYTDNAAAYIHRLQALMEQLRKCSIPHLKIGYSC